MKIYIFAVLAFYVLSPSLVAADEEHKQFYGVWGTQKQCNKEPIKEGVTVLASPFDISPRWLKQGTLWCTLNWGPVEKRSNGTFTAAHAQCGEDSVRGYFIGFSIVDEALTLRWDFPHSNGPLKRCPAK